MIHSSFSELNSQPELNSRPLFRAELTTPAQSLIHKPCSELNSQHYSKLVLKKFLFSES
uniref:Uncharacterized protein n=1 Tax=Arion vulgaris TaxID=1028688 RepID=A0A0B7A0U0_9EUPU